jgi:hypothetical protein
MLQASCIFLNMAAEHALDVPPFLTEVMSSHITLTLIFNV